MACVNTPGISGEHKRDFDLTVVLECFKKAACTSTINSSTTNEPTADDSSSVKPNSSNSPTHQSEISSTDVATVDIVAEDVMSPTNNHVYVCQGLLIEDYLKAFTELTRFFKLTGPIFAFVARDLTKKIVVIETHCNSVNRHNYSTLEGMIAFEVANKTARNKGSNCSASRAMLRLHWALEFIIEFMDQLRHVADDTKASTLVANVYHHTLSVHHPWWTRKLAYIAVYTLPSIKTLIDIMCKQDYEQVQALLGEVVGVGRPILEYTSKLYEKYGLSDIP